MMDIMLYDKDRAITVTGVQELCCASENGSKVWRMKLGDGRKVDVSAREWRCRVKKWKPVGWREEASVWRD